MEVYHNGEWGTVCDDGWDLNDAQVVCKELGFSNAVAATQGAFYGQGRGLVLLSGLECVGTEWTIANCSHIRGYFYCSRHQDAGVKCVSGTYIIFVSAKLMYVHKIKFITKLQVY